MGKIIKTSFESLADLKGRLPHLSRHLHGQGFTGILTLESDIAASMAYVGRNGSIEHVSGSRALVDRFKREEELRQENCARPL